MCANVFGILPQTNKMKKMNNMACTLKNTIISRIEIYCDYMLKPTLYKGWTSVFLLNFQTYPQIYGLAMLRQGWVVVSLNKMAIAG